MELPHIYYVPALHKEFRWEKIVGEKNVTYYLELTKDEKKNARYLRGDDVAAIEFSIKKWECIVNLFETEWNTLLEVVKSKFIDIIDGGRMSCPLCLCYYDVANTTSVCEICPVRKHTTKPGCVNTPYALWARILYGNGTEETLQTLRQHAEDELSYLRHLSYLAFQGWL